MYGLVMIVKDEAERIGACLESLWAYVDHWTILDTGSTDGTQDVIRDRMDGIPGRLIEGPFGDFGSARSRAFAAARGTADWLLASDADMRWSFDEWRPDPEVDAYLVDMGDQRFTNRLPLVLRGDLSWESRGAVHEYTVLTDGTLGRREPTDAIRIMQPGATWSDDKGRWHLDLLAPGVAAGDPRATFYAAQTHRDLGELDKARELYLARVRMGGWDQERFVAAYNAASLQPDWRLRVLELLGAWEMRRTRLEPLYDAVHALNEQGAYRTAYQLASVPIEPCTDDLFVYPAVWEWGLRQERDRAAAGLGMEAA